jgi:hypothetical protein
MMEGGRFRAYRFAGDAQLGEWQFDSGSGRIDAALERHFLEAEEC